MARINVVENVCAHRGMRFCRERHGNRKEFVCPYHQWNYTSRAICRACRSAAASSRTARCNGGMPADFKTAGPRPDAS
jgi:salicylate 5-hydroxylase large subunit